MEFMMQDGIRKLERTATGESYKRFDVRPLSPLIGAELGRVNLADPIDEQMANELRRALLEWKVIFFRNQDITPERHLEIARLWGEPLVNPFFPVGTEAGISRLAKDGQTAGTENVWHSDLSFLANPARGSVLRAIDVPAVGGDTMWADMAAAYDNLSDEVKERIDGLEAEHDWINIWDKHKPGERRDHIRERVPPAVHPVVKVHPETGRRTLYVNEPYTTRLLGLSEEESSALLSYLQLQARIPEFQVRFRWQPHSIAIWDNWAVQHYAINDYYPQRRVMERVAIVADGWAST
jgi:taurine dioxygenase